MSTDTKPRDPRTDPRPLDVVLAGGSYYRVIKIEGDQVWFDQPPKVEAMSLRLWRSYCDQAEVIHVAD